MNSSDLKLIVKEKYGEIASQSKGKNESSCCGATGCCSSVDYSIFSENYSQLEGYNPDADLGLGCGIPTEFARITKGNTVIDLGSGAGNDCFVARALVGESGNVIGIDMTEAMIEKARANAQKLGFTNVEFRLGDIENMPVSDSTADVIISNCVLNLVPDKEKAFGEIFRVLKPGGTLIFSTHNVRAVLVAPTWSRERVREVAERASRGIPAVRLVAIPLLTFAVVTRAVLWAGWKSFRRCKRLGSSVFWRGEGYVFDPAHGSFFAHYSIPKYVMAEVERHGFRLREMEGSEYPARKGELFTKWYYYVFEKPNGG